MHPPLIVILHSSMFLLAPLPSHCIPHVHHYASSLTLRASPAYTHDKQKHRKWYVHYFHQNAPIHAAKRKP